jgi:SAM-dependent methyltransferase
LLRSDPIADTALLAELYARSSFDYGDELHNLETTYGRYLAELAKSGEDLALLEIGCGSGFMLEHALDHGWHRVRGVEPSEAAVSHAGPDVRDAIVCHLMAPGLFGAEEFDAVCLFQVLDHVFDPAELLQECWAVLKPGGSILCLNHDVEALSARVLGRRSPIVDIEHTYLYSRPTLRALFESQGFAVRSIGAAWNRCSVGYLTRLLPLPAAVKRMVTAALTRARLAGISTWLPLGNVFIIADKPI